MTEIHLFKIKMFVSQSNFDNKLAHFDANEIFPVTIFNTFISFLEALTISSEGSESIVLIKKNSESKK